MTTIDYDPATGLPKPPKYRWRVTDFSSYGTWDVKMQRMVWGWLPITVSRFNSSDTPTPARIQHSAEVALWAWEEDQKRYAGNPYRGNYPPKRLEDK